jgi:hypothetical protein
MQSATGSNPLYFAYGSNMSTPRLRYRVPGCRFAFVARLPNYKVCFHKRSKDGSAKCNAFRTAEPTDAVIGAVYEIPTNEKPSLDRAEGLGRSMLKSRVAGSFTMRSTTMSGVGSSVGDEKPV